MLINEERVVTYTLSGLTAEEYAVVHAALEMLFETSTNTRQRDVAYELHQGMSRSITDPKPKPATDPAPITDPEPTRAIQVARMQDPNDDLSNPTISDDDPRPRRPVPGPAGGTFTRRPGN